MIGGKYKNIILVAFIIIGFVLFMAFTSIWVIGDISKNRSCIKTCDTPLTNTVRENKKEAGKK